MTKDEALKKAFKQAFQLGQDYWYQADHEYESQNKKSDVTRAKFEQLMEDAIKEALAQEKALQALHDENERLGLYKDAYAQPEEEKLHPVHIGVDVTREGTSVTAFYRKPDAVMEMFYSQFHPLAQPEQEPVAWVGLDLDGMVEAFHRVIEEHYSRNNPFHDPVNGDAMLALRELRGLVAYMKRNTTPPQRKPLTDEEIGTIAKEHIAIGTRSFEEFARRIEAAHGIKEKNT